MALWFGASVMPLTVTTFAEKSPWSASAKLLRLVATPPLMFGAVTWMPCAAP